MVPVIGDAYRDHSIAGPLLFEHYEKHGFDSYREFDELTRMLSEVISRGYVEQVPVMKPSRFSPTEAWYRNKETGEIYSLDPPEFPARGSWRRIDPEDLKEPGQFIQ